MTGPLARLAPGWESQLGNWPGLAWVLATSAESMKRIEGTLTLFVDQEGTRYDVHAQSIGANTVWYVIAAGPVKADLEADVVEAFVWTSPELFVRPGPVLNPASVRREVHEITGSLGIAPGTTDVSARFDADQWTWRVELRWDAGNADTRATAECFVRRQMHRLPPAVAFTSTRRHDND